MCELTASTFSLPFYLLSSLNISAQTHPYAHTMVCWPVGEVVGCRWPRWFEQDFPKKCESCWQRYGDVDKQRDSRLENTTNPDQALSLASPASIYRPQRLSHWEWKWVKHRWRVRVFRRQFRSETKLTRKMCKGLRSHFITISQRGRCNHKSQFSRGWLWSDWDILVIPTGVEWCRSDHFVVTISRYTAKSLKFKVKPQSVYFR